LFPNEDNDERVNEVFGQGAFISGLCNIDSALSVAITCKFVAFLLKEAGILNWVVFKL
jgi:hypothetical protein